MMEKIELEIVALSNSIAGSQSYAVVLGEKTGVRRLPIVIGGSEAQAIIVALENMSPSRPLTHDLMKDLLERFNIQLQEVVISDLKDGIFFAKLICSKEGESVEIDSRTSDALALAVRLGCPIFTYEFVLDQAGIIMDDQSSESETSGEDEGIEGVEVEEVLKPKTDDLTQLSTTKLQEMLDQLLTDEDYEKAAKVRDEIQRREQNS